MKPGYKYAVLAFAFLAALVATAARADGPRPGYKAPDTSSKLFGGDLKLDKADCAKTATLLAKAARSELRFLTKEDYDLASKLLTVALQLDPANKTAVVVNAHLAAGRIPEKDADWSRDAFLKDIHKLAAAEKDSKNKPDQQLAAYLYSSVNLLAPNDDDTYEIEMLKKAGFEASWNADAAASTTGGEVKVRPVAGSSKAARVQTKVKGLVVSEGPDGRDFGKVVEIIGTSPAESTGGSPRILTRVGPQMITAFEEGLRLVELRRPSARSMRLDISFDDKYSAKDGGSAGTAFTLLILSASGEFAIATDTAVTGDILVDGKVATVGGIAAKIRGAALDGCKVVSIPKVNAKQVGDLYLLQGYRSLWDIQILSAETIDDAIANVRADRSEKLVEAMKLFDELKVESKGKAPSSVSKEKLTKILDLAPNHLSAEWLLLAAQGKAPQKLSLPASITEAFAALGPMRHGLVGNFVEARYGSAKAYEDAKIALTKLKPRSDTAVLPVIASLEDYAFAYAQWGIAETKPDIGARFRAHDVFRAKQTAVKAAIEKVVSDKATMEQLMRD